MWYTIIVYIRVYICIVIHTYYYTIYTSNRDLSSRPPSLFQNLLQAKRRMEEERMAQLEKYREDYEARAAQEEMLRARTDALVAKMEKEEMELIQRRRSDLQGS